MNFNSIVNIILNERDEIGRAFRQTKQYAETPEYKERKGTSDTLNVKNVYKRYKTAQTRANKLEQKFKNKVPIKHVIWPDRVQKLGISILDALKHLLNKTDNEISVSVLKSWNQIPMAQRGDLGSYIMLVGNTTNLHEWYPVDSYTSDNKKEKTSLYVTDPSREKSLRKYTGINFDEGITNLKDVSWTSFSINVDIKELKKDLPLLHAAKTFLESKGLKQNNAVKQIKNFNFVDGKKEEYELYPMTGFLKSVKSVDGEVLNFKEEEGVKYT